MTNKLIQELESYIRSIVRDEMNAVKQPDKSEFQILIESLLPQGKTYANFLKGYFWVQPKIYSFSIRALLIGVLHEGTIGYVCVEFKSSPGTAYFYQMPRAIAEEWVLDKRPGQFFINNIKNKYSPEKENFMPTAINK